jgi:hypothetical protein
MEGCGRLLWRLFFGDSERSREESLCKRSQICITFMRFKFWIRIRINMKGRFRISIKVKF